MLSTFDPHRRVGNIDLFKGEFIKVEVRDPAGPPNVANLVVDRKKPFAVDVEWRLVGDDVPLYLAALGNGGNSWSVELFAESMGEGDEKRIASATVAVGAKSNPRTYAARLNVPAFTLAEGNPNGGPSGVYKLVTTCFLNSNLGAPGFDIAGFAEGPMIRVEDPI
jgi:hypothetical protein